MEQTREFRNKASHYGQVIFEKGAKAIQWGTFLTNYAGTTGYLLA